MMMMTSSSCKHQISSEQIKPREPLARSSKFQQTDWSKPIEIDSEVEFEMKLSSLCINLLLE